MGSLSDNFVLSTLNQTCISGVKRSEKLEQEAYTKHNVTDADRVRSVVDVFNTEALKAARKWQTALRNFHIGITTPWGEARGPRLTPNTSVQSLRDEVDKTKIGGLADWQVFRDNLQDHIDRDRRVMGTLFDESLYPTEAELEGRFTIEISFATVPDAEHDVRSGWDKQTRDAYVNQTIQREQRNVDKAMRTVLGRAHERLARVADRCEVYDGTKKGRFTDDLIPHVAIVRDMVKTFNLTDDPEIRDWLADIDRKILTTTSQELRENDTKRKQVGADALKISKRIKASNVGGFGKAPVLPSDSQ